MSVVWIVNHYAQAPSGPGGTRHHSLARHLLVHGWQPLIIAGSCEHNTGRQRLNPGEHQRFERCDGVDFLWLRVPGEPSIGGWRRFASMLMFAFTLLRPTATRGLPRPDVVIGSTVHPFAAWAACLLARRHCVDFVFEVRDLWPRTLVAMGAIRPGGLLDRGLGRLECWLAHCAARIVVLMPGGIEYYQALGIPPSRPAWLPNGAELPHPPCSSASDPAPFNFFTAVPWSGQCPRHCARCHGRAGSRGLGPEQLIPLVGDGTGEADLQQRAQRLGLRRSLHRQLEQALQA